MSDGWDFIAFYDWMGAIWPIWALAGALWGTEWVRWAQCLDQASEFRSGLAPPVASPTPGRTGGGASDRTPAMDLHDPRTAPAPHILTSDELRPTILIRAESLHDSEADCPVDHQENNPPHEHVA